MWRPSGSPDQTFACREQEDLITKIHDLLKPLEYDSSVLKSGPTNSSAESFQMESSTCLPSNSVSVVIGSSAAALRRTTERLTYPNRVHHR